MSLKYEPASEPLHMSAPAKDALLFLLAASCLAACGAAAGGWKVCPAYLRLVDFCTTQL